MIFVKDVLHACDTFAERRDPPEGVDEFTYTWFCPVCRQGWTVTSRKDSGSAQRRGRGSWRWKRAQRRAIQSGERGTDG